MFKVSWKILFVLFVLPWLITEAAAIESCYDRIRASADRPPPERTLYVLIDQTAPWTPREIKQVSRLVSLWPGPGDMIRVITFSAVSEGRDITEVLAVQPDAPPPESASDRWRSSQVRAFEACFSNQNLKAKIAIKRGIRYVFEHTNPSIKKSEILQSLHRFAVTRLSKTNSSEITILIASDFLENSSVMSFYWRGKTIEIDGDRAMAYINQIELLPDFHGARIFGIGLGVDSKLHKSFRKAQSVASFWKKYFEQGKGKLIELGMPTLQRGTLD
uniref:VWFA domain-containing protein n=1 Tax=Candidatus Kentrum sp. MB TaxID=2138164 RepID=A0A450XCY9_9GAMM|nr:MAG: hypothetical protein BECKMB1821G_GA0114241_10096 [Candidatus Kentron sp. MB]VFK27119.1 MAG: hypothetical protein BECKMB1821I_GA0114274_100246 [Candidatus Kentron sp. MB]VFK74899.1 MAG: hypothetical protein BECKMB1821H_GA0114242_10127 [Candidatus Kentron sp. MB]